METLILQNDEKVKLNLTYFGIFDFLKTRKDIARDLVSVVQHNDNAIDTETMIQIIYVAYIGGKNTSNYSYEEFVELLPVDISEHSRIFMGLVKPQKKEVSKNLSENAPQPPVTDQSIENLN